MSMEAPLVHKAERNVPAAAIAADSETEVLVAPFAGTVTAVNYIAATVLTGANTDTRSVFLVNKGAAGSGTAQVATKAFVSGVNAAADVVTAVTLSGTAANLVVSTGDVLVWQSTHGGSTGLADPGGLVHVEITRS